MDKSISDYKKLWLPELFICLFLSILSIILFWLTDWDLQAARYFYSDSDPTESWPAQHFFLWNFFYQAAPIISGLFALASITILILALFQARFAKLKIYALFSFLSLVVGPGIIVNGIFKDNWGRPRPRQIKEFGGNKDFIKVGAKRERLNGKSFPCGHSSVGFLFFIFWFIFKRHRSLLATISLFFTFTIGILMGIGRMAAGGHFLSDVIWSAIIPFLVSWFLYYFVLKIPYKEDHKLLVDKNSNKKTIQLSIYISLIVLSILGASLATPFHKKLQNELHRERKVSELLIEIDHVENLVLNIESGTSYYFTSNGVFNGFGLPNNRLIHHIGIRDTYAYYKIKHSGLFTEKTANLIIHIYPEKLNRITVNLKYGNIKVHEDLQKLGILKINTP